MVMNRAVAEMYASWFRCVSDPTRLQVLHLLASGGRPMKVGEISSLIGVAQSTTSVHLQRLLDDEFVFVDRSGTTSWFSVNSACIEQFPTAAQQIMGVLSGSRPLPAEGMRAPWRQTPH